MSDWVPEPSSSRKLESAATSVENTAAENFNDNHEKNRNTIYGFQTKKEEKWKGMHKTRTLKEGKKAAGKKIRK